MRTRGRSEGSSKLRRIDATEVEVVEEGAGGFAFRNATRCARRRRRPPGRSSRGRGRNRGPARARGERRRHVGAAGRRLVGIGRRLDRDDLRRSGRLARRGGWNEGRHARGLPRGRRRGADRVGCLRCERAKTQPSLRRRCRRRRVRLAAGDPERRLAYLDSVTERSFARVADEERLAQEGPVPRRKDDPDSVVHDLDGRVVTRDEIPSRRMKFVSCRPIPNSSKRRVAVRSTAPAGSATRTSIPLDADGLITSPFHGRRRRGAHGRVAFERSRGGNVARVAVVTSGSPLE